MIIIGAEITGGEVGAKVGTAMRVIGIEAGNEITIIDAMISIWTFGSLAVLEFFGFWP